MDGYSISQVAERTGLTASTLRFYEQSGLLEPARTPAGYRCYDDHHVETLRFIARAKGFGLKLDEITDLTSMLDDERCAPVQGRLRDLIESKIDDAHQRVAELLAFTAELQRVATVLSNHTAEGACDDACGCTTDPGRSTITCTLSPGDRSERFAHWQATAAEAIHRDNIAGGVRLRFGRAIDVAAIAHLVAAEQSCCEFFTFNLSIGPDAVTLDVIGPEDARPLIESLVGSAL